MRSNKSPNPCAPRLGDVRANRSDTQFGSVILRDEMTHKQSPSNSSIPATADIDPTRVAHVSSFFHLRHRRNDRLRIERRTLGGLLSLLRFTVAKQSHREQRRSQ